MKDTRSLYVSFLLVLPFVFFLFFVVPSLISSKFLHVGNDFPEHRIWWMQTQAYYLFKGMLPLWNPLDDFGVIFLGWRGFAYFYPLGWWLYLPFYFSGGMNYFAEYFQISMHMGIGLVGLYLLLKRLSNISHTAAIISAIIFIFNHRFVDSIRYPNTIETIAWTPWIVYFLCKTIDNFSMTSHASKDSKIVDWLLLCLTTLLCWLAGYGQLTYISLLLCGVLLLFRSKNLVSFTLGLSGISMGTLLAIGVLLPIAIQTQGSMTRGGGNIQFAASYPLCSYFNMFVWPFAADVHSSSFFFPIFLIFLVVGLFISFKSSNDIDIRTSAGMLIGMIIIGDLSLGNDGLLFKYFYKYMPFYSSFRIQGRNNWITLLPISYFCANGFEFMIRSSIKKKIVFFVVTIVISSAVVYIGFNDANFIKEYSSLARNWITKTEVGYSLVNLAMTASLLVVSMIFFHRRKIVVFVGAIILCMIFVKYYAIHSTWIDMNMHKLAIMKTDDFFPNGIFMPFMKGSSHRLISPVILAESEKVPKYDAYTQVIGEGRNHASVFNRFAFSPDDKSLGGIGPDISIIKFHPNELEFNVKAHNSGKLLLFTTYSKFWKSNLEYRRGIGEFSPFIVFDIGNGETKISLEFRPLILVLSGMITLVGIFVVLSSVFFILGNRRTCRISLGCGLFVLSFYIYGIFFSEGFTSQDVFGNSSSFGKYEIIKSIDFNI